MFYIEIIIRNTPNLEKTIIVALIKIVRQMCNNKSISEIKECITNELPISIESKYDVSEEFLDFLKKYNIDAIIKYDNQNLTIDKFIEKTEDDEVNYFDEENDVEEIKIVLQTNLLKHIVKNIMNDIKKDDLINNCERDFVKGKLAAYYDVLIYIKNKAENFEIDYEEVGLNTALQLLSAASTNDYHACLHSRQDAALPGDSGL